MAKLNNTLAAVLFLVVTAAGSWFVLKQGAKAKQQRVVAEASAIYAPPLAEPMAQTALPWRFAFEALPQKLRWRRFVGYAEAKVASSVLCFWADFSPEDSMPLEKAWGLEEAGRHVGIFVDGFLPAWFLEELCREALLCPGKERAFSLKASEAFIAPRGRHRLYWVPRLQGLFGCVEEA